MESKVNLQATPNRALRFASVAMTCVHGDPFDRRSWSGAPANLSAALGRLGVAVENIHSGFGRFSALALAAHHLVRGYGWPRSMEQILRTGRARRRNARRVAAAISRTGVRDVLHTGALDLPATGDPPGIRHFLYCDDTWALSLRHRPDAAGYSAQAVAEFERLERDSLIDLEGVFTFGAHVRDHLIQHYGLAPERVVAVGSGMGPIEPFFGEKDYARPALLFVAKHLFKAKGGALLLEAFAIALRRRPDLRLTIVGDERSRAFVPRHPSIAFRAHLPWAELQELYRTATLLTQPMLNDPWGQVYVEALASRTPVLGLRRNGLPEILGHGRYGFLVETANPQRIADAIIAALGDPDRLARMGREGQRHVLANYSWDRVAERIAFL